MIYTPITNYKTVSVNHGGGAGQVALHTVARNSLVTYYGSLSSDIGTTAYIYINTTPTRTVIAANDNLDVGNTPQNLRVSPTIFVPAGTVIYTNGGGGSSTIGTLHIFELD